jgi:hypothetical protein
MQGLKIHGYRVSQHSCIGCHFNHTLNHTNKVERTDSISTQSSFSESDSDNSSWLSVDIDELTFSFEEDISPQLAVCKPKTEEDDVPDWNHLMLSALLSELPTVPPQEQETVLARSFDESDMFDSFPSSFIHEDNSTCLTEETSLEDLLIQDYLRSQPKSSPIPISSPSKHFFIGKIENIFLD